MDTMTPAGAAAEDATRRALLDGTDASLRDLARAFTSHVGLIPPGLLETRKRLRNPSSATVDAAPAVPRLKMRKVREKAQALRDAYRADPHRFDFNKHGAFADLYDRAGLSPDETRAVRRGIGYEADPRGFEHFIVLLFASEGEPVPK